MKRIAFLIVLTLIFIDVKSQVINVPGDYTNIQDAIVAASDGDTVLVAEGIYYEHINFLGKKITVASHYLTNPQNPFIVSNTIIDGSIPAASDSNSVVHFVSGEDTNSVVFGFTIRNGSGTGYKGGGILVYNSGAKIVNNRIIDNQVLPSGSGGGIYAAAFDYSPQHFVIIEKNTIVNDSLYGNFQMYGAGIVLNIDGRIKNNLIQHCDILAPPVGETGWAAGGAIFCNLYHYEADSYYSVEISGNTIKDNSIESVYTTGGGIYVNGGKVILKDNIIKGNTAYSNEPNTENSAGGGALMGWLREGSVITGNTFEDNQALHASENGYGGGLNLYIWADTVFSNFPIRIEKNIFRNNYAGRGGGMRMASCNAYLQNNYFYGNHSHYYGGAILIRGNIEDPDTVIKVINNTFIANTSDYEETVSVLTSDKCLMMNNIFYDTAAIYQIWNEGDTSSLQLHYNVLDESKIYGGWEGSANIFEDPELIPGTYELLASSPCLGAGSVKHKVFNIDFICPPDDIDGTPRPQGGTTEIGAFELMFVDIEEDLKEKLDIVISPNPFIDRTTITFSSDGGENRISLFDMAGTMVLQEQVPCNALERCEFQLERNCLSPGIYLIRIVTGEMLETGKLVVARR